MSYARRRLRKASPMPPNPRNAILVGSGIAVLRTTKYTFRPTLPVGNVALNREGAPLEVFRKLVKSPPGTWFALSTPPGGVL